MTACFNSTCQSEMMKVCVIVLAFYAFDGSALKVERLCLTFR